MNDKMCRLVEDEIDKMADKGLSSSNIDNAYKLTKMKYYLKTTEAMDDYNGGSSYYGDNSYGRHYVRGHYSNEGDSYDRYSQAKYDYRHSRSDGKRIMTTLDDYMNDLTGRLNEMMKDADSQEERDTIRRYISKVQNM